MKRLDTNQMRQGARFGFVQNLIKRKRIQWCSGMLDTLKAAKTAEDFALNRCRSRSISFNDQRRPKTLISDDITNSSH